MNENYQRTPKDLADEYLAVLGTVAARKGRLPATQEGIDYAARMDAIEASVACCLSEPGVLVSTPEDLATAEQALIDARTALKESVGEFLAMDTAAKSTTRAAVPQVAVPAAATRTPTASAAQ